MLESMNAGVQRMKRIDENTHYVHVRRFVSLAERLRSLSCFVDSFHLFHSLLKTMYLNERAVHYLKFTITNILIIGFLHLSLQSKDSSKTTPYKEVEKNGERSFAKTNQ